MVLSSSPIAFLMTPLLHFIQGYFPSPVAHAVIVASLRAPQGPSLPPTDRHSYLAREIPAQRMLNLGLKLVHPSSPPLSIYPT